MSLELLSLGAEFMGGLLGHSQQRKAARQNQRNYEYGLKQAQAQFDAQMDQSVQRRVADAKKAGVHPLFALGASVGSSPTLSAGQPPRAPTGSAMGRALEGMARSLGVIEQNRASARRDEAEAALLASQTKRLEQEMSARGRDSPSVRTYPYGTQPAAEDFKLGPAEYYMPQVPLSQRPGVRAGTEPGTIDVILPDRRKINIPSPDIGLDEIAQIDYAYQRAKHKTADMFMWIHNKVKEINERNKKYPLRPHR